MRKLFMLTTAMAVLALGGIAVGGEKKGDKKKFDSTITLEYDQGPYDPYDPYYEEAVFSGKVKVQAANKAAKKNKDLKKKCKKKRTVIIKNLDAPKGTNAFATVRTDEKGKYTVEADTAYNEPGTYRAKVKKKTKVKAEVKCFGAKSNEVEVPTP